MGRPRAMYSNSLSGDVASVMWFNLNGSNATSNQIATWGRML